jgi:KaiC
MYSVVVTFPGDCPLLRIGELGRRLGVSDHVLGPGRIATACCSRCAHQVASGCTPRRRSGDSAGLQAYLADGPSATEAARAALNGAASTPPGRPPGRLSPPCVGRVMRRAAAGSTAEPSTASAGIIATLQENPTQLNRMLTGLGWPAADPAVEVMYRSPVDIYIDEWVHDLLETAERTQARRSLIDSLLDLQMAAIEDTRFREFMYSLLQRFSRQGISVLTTYETPGLHDGGALPEFALSHLADNLIRLGYHREHGAMSRSLAVIKSGPARPLQPGEPGRLSTAHEDDHHDQTGTSPGYPGDGEDEAGRPGAPPARVGAVLRAKGGRAGQHRPDPRRTPHQAQ